METGKLIRELRIKKGMTQEELAVRTELSARTIQRIENNEVDPRAYTLQMIARALEVDYGIFVTTEPEEESKVHDPDAGNWLGLLYISSLIPLVFPAVVIWKLKKDKIKDLTRHYRDVVGYQLKVWLAILAGLWVYLKAGQPIPLLLIFIGNAAFSIFSTIKIVSEKSYRK